MRPHEHAPRWRTRGGSIPSPAGSPQRARRPRCVGGSTGNPTSPRRHNDPSSRHAGRQLSPRGLPHPEVTCDPMAPSTAPADTLSARITSTSTARRWSKPCRYAAILTPQPRDAENAWSAPSAINRDSTPARRPAPPARPRSRPADNPGSRPEPVQRITGEVGGATVRYRAGVTLGRRLRTASSVCRSSRLQAIVNSNGCPIRGARGSMSYSLTRCSLSA